MGVDDAFHAEYGDMNGTPIITALACSLAGTQITIEPTAGTMLSAAHGGALAVIEQTTCNYGLGLDVQQLASERGMVVSAVDDTGEVRAIERLDHPFFVGTLYQPQLTSALGQSHPVFDAFVRAAYYSSTRV